MRNLRKGNASNMEAVNLNKRSGGSSRKEFKAGFFSKRRPEAITEKYPDSPLELSEEAKSGDKPIYLYTK